MSAAAVAGAVAGWYCLRKRVKPQNHFDNEVTETKSAPVRRNYNEKQSRFKNYKSRFKKD